MAIVSRNPATGLVLKEFTRLEAPEIEARLAKAQRCFLSFRATPFRSRTEWLGRAAEILVAEKERFGRLMTLEMGKPIKSAIQEAEKCATACRYYAEHAEALLAPRLLEGLTGGAEARVVYQPIGAVLAVMPWNFPFWQVFRFAAPALAAGNVGLLKHASNVPQCALAIEEILARAGFPDGAFQSLLIDSSQVEGLIADARVMAVTLTGSERAGASVAAAAGRAIKKTVLELGGSDPFVVMPSANLEHAAATAVLARTVNNGQSCIAAKRFFVHDQVAKSFTELFVRALGSLKIGDPLDPGTEIGPLATPEIREEVARQVEASVSLGARLLIGGKRLEGPGAGGCYYAPTALADPPRGSPASDDEIFGPIASIFTVSGLDEAIERANASRFGLGACLWSEDAGEQRQFIERIESGSCFINAMVASDARLPFGGVKSSGFGRELGPEGIREFLNTKTVWIAGAR